MAIFAEVTESEYINEKHPLVKGVNMINCAIPAKMCEIVCELVLFTNRKSHAGFRLVLTSVTLNDIEPRNDCRRALSLQ